MAGGRAAGRAAEGVIAKVVKPLVREAEKVGGRAAARDAERTAARGAERTAGRDLTSDVGRTFDHEHPGPLGSSGPANTFTDGRYTVGEMEHPTILYRAGDDAATTGEPHLGQYWTDTPPESVDAVRQDLAVLPEWPGGGQSPLNTGYAVMMPEGTRYYHGEVAPQSHNGVSLPGGGQQYYIEKPWEMHPPPKKLYQYPLPP